MKELHSAPSAAWIHPWIREFISTNTCLVKKDEGWSIINWIAICHLIYNLAGIIQNRTANILWVISIWAQDGILVNSRKLPAGRTLDLECWRVSGHVCRVVTRVLQVTVLSDLRDGFITYQPTLNIEVILARRLIGFYQCGWRHAFKISSVK